MKYQRIEKITAILLIISIIVINLATRNYAEAADKTVGIVVSDKNGSYTFYDMNNSTDGSATFEITSAGNIMVPLKKLVKLMPVLTYKYDSTKKTATIVNTSNGKKIVYTKNSQYLSYYSSSKAKAAKKTMAYKMYVSKTSSSVMVHMSSLKWVLQATGGYDYYTIDEMKTAGYDTSVYSGLILYNPYQTVTEIPKATKVTGISSTVKVTIPEGYSVAQIFDLLVKKGICASTESLYDAMENYDFTYYPLVSAIEENANRCFKLEGYLYPDTYEFYRLSKAQDVIGKFLRNTEAKLTTAKREQAQTMGYSMDEILTIASIVEKETADKDMMPTIASVIYNRLNIKMKLQFDSSIYYVERYIKPYISDDINRYNSYYNTYKCSALPAGPISNPGKSAIEAALNPATTDYLYFYSDAEGAYHFSVDWVNPNAISTNTDDTESNDNTNSMDSTNDTANNINSNTSSTSNILE
ncbi:MAG: endolytic transglycosylase MltG [Herbinix sp.]|nr:endolytic transglycosylase MltG [Herbinix sp.]